MAEFSGGTEDSGSSRSCVSRWRLLTAAVWIGYAVTPGLAARLVGGFLLFLTVELFLLLGPALVAGMVLCSVAGKRSNRSFFPLWLLQAAVPLFLFLDGKFGGKLCGWQWFVPAVGIQTAILLFFLLFPSGGEKTRFGVAAGILFLNLLQLGFFLLLPD